MLTATDREAERGTERGKRGAVPTKGQSFEKGPSLAWRLVIGGRDPECRPHPRYVVLAPTAREAIHLFKRRGVTGVTERSVERWPDLDPPAKERSGCRT